MTASNELFLIDGNSLAYRAFFALPESIATSKGEPTNAILGFASMLAKILSEYSPKAVLVVWDAGMSGREQTYPEYKAQRPPRPDLLSEQWPHLQPLVEAFGFRNVRIEGYEADDVIASLAERAKDEQVPVVIVTGDRDAYQLVDGDRVQVMTTSRGITDTKTYDREAVIERYGIPPELVPDFIGLKGDTSDNIPGVPGIGDKTAAQLLQQFGSLEEVLANVEEISGTKRRQNLTDHADDARTSKRLAVLDREIDCGVDVDEEMARTPDRSRLREMLVGFELREVLRRIEESLGAEQLAGEDAGAATVPAVAVETCAAGELDKLLPPGRVAIAASWTDSEACEFGAYAGGERAYAGRAGDPAEVAKGLGDRVLVGHDLKPVLRRMPADVAIEPAHDTLVAGYLLEPTRRLYPLGELAAEAGLAVSPAAGEDLVEQAVLCWRLAAAQGEELETQGLASLFEEVELPLVAVLARMEQAGVKLDTYRLGEISAKVGEQLAELEEEIHELAGEGFTIGSPQQLAEILFEKLGLTRKRRGKTGYSTDARVLAAIRDEHPIVAKVERWRELSKLKNTYLDSLPDLIDPKTDRLHTTFNQTATATGRLSSTNPNLQNIPVRTPLGREIRDCFVAEEGARLVSVDYSQVELRVLAHCADEGVLREIFSRDEDVHAATAAQVFDLDPGEVGQAERAKAKAVNFGIVYGQSPFGLSQQLGIPQEEAAAYIAEYLGRFPAVQEFIRATIAKAERDGYVRTLFGRIRPIPELRANQHQTRQLGERLAVNTVIQGSAADIIKLAMVDCYRALRKAKLATKLVLQIHDELLFECPAAEVDAASALVREKMEAAYDLDPPLKADVGVGETWMGAKA